MRQMTCHFFTLTELLVVIAVITVLMSLLLPALGKAKDFARQINCSSNVSQLGLSLNMYADDDNDALPPFNLNPQSSWILYKFFPNLLADGEYIKPPIWKLQSYGNIITGIWRCPSIKETKAGNLDNEIQWGGGYGVNYCHLIKNVESIRRCKIANPSRIFLLGDGIGTNVGQTAPQPCGTSYKLVCPVCFPWPASTGSWAAPRHGGKPVVCFADGHAEARIWESLRVNEDDVFAHYSQ